MSKPINNWFKKVWAWIKESGPQWGSNLWNLGDE